MPLPTVPAGASLAAFIADKQAAGKQVFTTSRSAAITHQRCPRKRYFEYHYEGTGITKVRLAAPLATGGYTHIALAALLAGQSASDAAGLAKERYAAECNARGLDIEATESFSEVGSEQIALVEAFTHLAARRIIPQILDEYEIVDVEREEWFVLYEDSRQVLVMEARCDGLLRERSGLRIIADDPTLNQQAAVATKLVNHELGVPLGDLYVLSWKTTATWDRRKAKEAKVDMQGLSEAYAVELRVGEPVLGTKMVHLLKGKREQYPEDSGHYIQKSPMIYAWMNSSGPTPQFAWAYAWDDPEKLTDWGRPYKHKLGKGWKRVFVSDVMPIAEWVQMLDEGDVQPEAGDALERQFISPMPEPRSPAQKQRWLRQIENQELMIVEAIQQLQSPLLGMQAEEEMLDSLFPQYTHSCNYPSECAFWGLCHGSEEVENPMSLYQIRQPHHPGESMLVGDE